MNEQMRENYRLKLQKTVAELDNSSDECLLAVSDLRVMELEDMVAALKNALAEANDHDAAAEGENGANFSHKRKEFDELATRAGRLLRGAV